MKQRPGILSRRLKRMQRRRRVGRAYDMALEIARFLPVDADILDVGCGDGFIAHHLSAMTRSRIIGIDLAGQTAAPIDYKSYDGEHFPAPSAGFDAVLLCYVLHHARDAGLLLQEVRRVIRDDGLVVIYEDIPRRLVDRGVCWIHRKRWNARSGPCKFRLDRDWRSVFEAEGFDVVRERPLSRWRNLSHPVARHFYILRARGTKRECK